MKNTMFTGEMNEKVLSMFESVQGLFECLKPDEEKAESATLLERVHSLYVLKAVKELKDTAIIVKMLNEMPEEEFEAFVTDGGKKDLEKAEMEMMLRMMMDIHSDKE